MGSTKGGRGRKRKGGREKRMGFIWCYHQVMNPIKQTTGPGLGMGQIMTLQIKLYWISKYEKIKNFLLI